MTDSRELLVVRLGMMSYAEALDFQRAVARARIAGDIDQDVLLLVEHPHVITLGRSAKGRTLTASPALLAARGVELFEVDRGGDVTYHGPGQLVGYPILDLKRHKQDLHWYLRQVEEALIRALAQYGLTGWRNAGYTGVWVGAQGDEGHAAASTSSATGKIASIGVHARDWVTWHGFALNVVTDLAYFQLMIPCGIDGVRMTSIVHELSSHTGAERAAAAQSVTEAISVETVGVVVARTFADVFALSPRDVSVEALRIPAPTTEG